MKYFNVKPLFLIAVPRPLSNISTSCPARFAAQDFLDCSNHPGQPPAAKSRLQIFLDVENKRVSASVNVFFQVFVGFFIVLYGYPDRPSFCGPRSLEEEHSRQAKEKSLDRNNVKTFYKLVFSQIYVSIAVGWFWQIDSVPKYKTSQELRMMSWSLSVC